MNRISSLLALGLLSLGLATSASAQTKVTKLIIQNTTGSTSLSQTSNGLWINNQVVLQNPSVTGNTVTLLVPSTSGMGNEDFTFPTSGGTLLTTTANDVNGDAIVAAINAASSTSIINASHLDLSGVLGGGVQTVAPLNTTLNVGGTATDIDISLNLNNANTWLQTQTFPTTINQGNALINSINAGNIALNGYVTNSYLTSNYTTTTNMNAAIAAAVSAATGGVTSVSGSGVIDFPATAGANRSDATITVTGAAVGDAVALATPLGLIFSENTVVSAWVSAADTVTIRFSNNGNGGSINPPSATFKAVVFK